MVGYPYNRILFGNNNVMIYVTKWINLENIKLYEKEARHKWPHAYNFNYIKCLQYANL